MLILCSACGNRLRADKGSMGAFGMVEFLPIYREAIASSLEGLRLRAEVSLLSPAEYLAGEVERAGAHLVVANRISPAVKEAAFWVGGGECLDAKICANGCSKFVRVMRVEHVPEALDEAEAKLPRRGSPLEPKDPGSASARPRRDRPYRA